MSTNDAKDVSQQKQLKDVLKKSLMNLEKLPFPEQETLLCLVTGGETDGLSVGDYALTSENQHVTIIGFGHEVDEKMVYSSELQDK